MNRAGTTILMVEQNVRFGLTLADQGTVMSAGTVALAGTATEIADHPRLMDIFFGATPEDLPATVAPDRADVVR